MVHGYHVIWGAYGFWLPNDPRGSWSDFVHAWELARFGKATKSLDRVEVEPAAYSAWRTKARRALKYPPVTFSDSQAIGLAEAFEGFSRQSNLCIWACSILPEHVHMVLGRHRYKIEQAVNLLKGVAQRQLIDSGLHPLRNYRLPSGRVPSMWADKCWKVFLDTDEAIENAIAYVETNPEREGRSPQFWPFVRPFTGVPAGGWIAY